MVSLDVKDVRLLRRIVDRLGMLASDTSGVTSLRTARTSRTEDKVSRAVYRMQSPENIAIALNCAGNDTDYPVPCTSNIDTYVSTYLSTRTVEP